MSTKASPRKIAAHTRTGTRECRMQKYPHCSTTGLILVLLCDKKTTPENRYSCTNKSCMYMFNVTHVFPLLPLFCTGNLSSDSKAPCECKLCLLFGKIKSNSALITLKYVYVTGIVVLNEGELDEDICTMIVKCVSRDKDSVRLKMENVVSSLSHDFVKKHMIAKTRDMFACAGDENDVNPEMPIDKSKKVTKITPCFYATNTLMKHMSLRMGSFQQRSPFQMTKGTSVIVANLFENQKAFVEW